MAHPLYAGTRPNETADQSNANNNRHDTQG